MHSSISKFTPRSFQQLATENVISSYTCTTLLTAKADLLSVASLILHVENSKPTERLEYGGHWLLEYLNKGRAYLTSSVLKSAFLLPAINCGVPKKKKEGDECIAKKLTLPIA